MKVFKRVFIGISASLLALITVAGIITCFYYPHYTKKQHTITPECSYSAGEIKVMSANVRCWTPQDILKQSWCYRADLIINNIEQEAPSIIGFQEANKWQYAYLCKALPTYDSVVTYRDNTIVAESCPIFYNTELFDLIDKGSFWLSETPEEMSKDWGAACYRICSYVILKDKATEKQFVVFNTHLDHISDEARIKGIEVVLDKIEQFGGLPSMIMGDFNAEEGSQTYISATKNFDDAKYKAETAENLHSATYQNYGKELNGEPIDYFMISKTGFHVDKYSVVTTTYNGVYPSDHFPITVELNLE
ncbi:MAG: endonuclease/exonuclease/phosphatase family protein [Eubacterium sp.]|nr:endonuclease/exonuclease/phosphatase family protein [Eubacterium sp.]